MANLEHGGLCNQAEYQRTFNERLKEGDITDAQILMLFLRLKQHAEALKIPVIARSIPHHIGQFTVEVTAIDEDLQPLRDWTPAEGELANGIWNVNDPANRIYYAEDTHKIPCYDGIFAAYDDGIGMSDFERELVGAGALGGMSDLSSFKL